MKKYIFVFLILSSALFLSAQNTSVHSDYFTVSESGSDFSSISSAVSFAESCGIDTFSVLIYGSIPSENVVISEDNVEISFFGINTASNCDLGSTVFLIKGQSVTAHFQNISCSKIRNEGKIDYFGLFFCMIDTLVSEGDIAFSDIFGSEIISSFAWKSSGYMGMSQGKNIGYLFSGVMADVYNTASDTMTIFQKNGVKHIYWDNDQTYIKYANIPGSLTVKNSIVLYGDSSSIYMKPNEFNMSGNMKIKGKSSYFFFDGKNAKLDIAAALNLTGTLYGASNISSNSFTAAAGMPLALEYQPMPSGGIRWQFSSSEDTKDKSLYENNEGIIKVARRMVPDAKGSIEPMAAAALFFADKKTAVNNNSWTSVPFSSESFQRGDTLNFRLSKKKITDIIIAADGVYSFYGDAMFISSSESARNAIFGMRILINGKELNGSGSELNVNLAQGESGKISTSAVSALKQGDIISLQIWMEEGFSLYSPKILDNKYPLSLTIVQIK